MKFKNIIIISVITIFVVFIAMFGTSYAYYVSGEGAEMEVTTGDIDTVAVIFNQDQYINFNTGIPLMEHQVEEYANKAIFTLVPNNKLEGYEIAVTISLTDLHIDEELKVSDFKYNLSCNDGTKDIILTPSSMGTGLDFTDEVIKSDELVLGSLLSTDNFNVNNTYTCNLMMYLAENNMDQNNLMNKHFSGYIKVNTIFRR